MVFSENSCAILAGCDLFPSNVFPQPGVKTFSLNILNAIMYKIKMEL